MWNDDDGVFLVFMIVVVLVLACFSSCGHVGDSVVGDKDDGDDDGCGRAI